MPATFRDDRIMVIEIGSHTIRAIDALGESFEPPRVRVETKVGKCTIDEKAMYNVGDDIQPDDEIIYPVEKGLVIDWTAFQALMQYVLFKQLGRPWPPTPRDPPFAVLLSVSPQWSMQDREDAARMFFEEFLVSGFVIHDSPVLAAFAANTGNGLVIDIGLEKTEVYPVLDGHVVPSTGVTVPFGGKDTTNYLHELLLQDPPKNERLEALPKDSINFEFCEALKRSDIFEVLVHSIDKKDKLKKSANDADASIFDTIEVEEVLDGTEDLGRIIAEGKTEEYINRKKKEENESSENKAQQTKKLNSERPYNEFVFNNTKYHIGDVRFKAGRAFLGQKVDIARIVFEQIHNNFIPVSRRADLWNNLFVIGMGSAIRGLSQELHSLLVERYCLSQGGLDLGEEMGVTVNKNLPMNIPPFKRISDYFRYWKADSDNQYKAYREEISFLGACIAAKMTFNDASSSLWASREEYHESGPKAIHVF